MNKINVFVDFDDTIVNTTKKFVEVANKRFNKNEDYKKCNSWNFSNLFPNITLKDVNEIFCSNDFFKNLPAQDNCLDVLYNLENKINLNIVTIGLKDNLIKKEKWLNNNIKNKNYKFIGIEEIQGIKIDKSNIDMYNGIFVDDRFDNILASNAKIKILYKNFNNYSWQEIIPNTEVYISNTWKEIEECINFFYKNKI